MSSAGITSHRLSVGSVVMLTIHRHPGIVSVTSSLQTVRDSINCNVTIHGHPRTVSMNHYLNTKLSSCLGSHECQCNSDDSWTSMERQCEPQAKYHIHGHPGTVCVNHKLNTILSGFP